MTLSWLPLPVETVAKGPRHRVVPVGANPAGRPNREACPKCSVGASPRLAPLTVVALVALRQSGVSKCPLNPRTKWGRQ